jgi:hypothetical protein
MNSTLIRASPFGEADVYLKVFLVAGCILLISNCSLFKNSASDLRKSHEVSTAVTEVKSLEQKDWLRRSDGFFHHQDSSNSDFAIQIRPKGTFSFSPDKGFSGEAESILLTGKASTGSVSSDWNTTLQQDKGSTEKQMTLKKKGVSDQKIKLKKSAPSWKWMIAALAFMGVLCFFLYTKLKLILKL